MTPAATQFGLPGKGRIRQASAGRVCAAGGCETVLSTYNSSPVCWGHQVALPGGPLRNHDSNRGPG